MPEKVVLAYSGGLDTSIIIPWLKENYAYDVIAMVGDVGQGDDLEPLSKKLIRPAHRRLLWKTCAKNFCVNTSFPTLKAGAVYEHKYLAGNIHGASGDRETSGGSCFA